MRTVFDSNREVAHIWAQQTHPEGRCGGAMYFRGERIYSYGPHFCIARILPSGTVVFTTRTYSSSTTKHQGYARYAANHRPAVYCHDPDASVALNMRHARVSIAGSLEAAKAPRIRENTRLRHKAAALRTAEQANAYLAAMPDNEKVGVIPIDLTQLEAIREEIERAEAVLAEAQAEKERQRQAELMPYLEAWRKGEDVRHSLYRLPVALRLRGKRVETSHGAAIPVRAALALWPVILKTREEGKGVDMHMALGDFTLYKIRADGSIVVGCHDIAAVEIDNIARQLNLM